jgi:hypothetical protein
MPDRELSLDEISDNAHGEEGAALDPSGLANLITSCTPAQPSSLPPSEISQLPVAHDHRLRSAQAGVAGELSCRSACSEGDAAGTRTRLMQSINRNQRAVGSLNDLIASVARRALLTMRA